MYLSDLTFIEDANPDNIGRLINFGKRQLLSKVLLEISTYQQKVKGNHPFIYLPVVLLESGTQIGILTEDFANQKREGTVRNFPSSRAERLLKPKLYSWGTTKKPNC